MTPGTPGSETPRHVEPRSAQVHHVPGRGNREIKMRIVGEDRLAGGRTRARNRPRVRTRLRFAAAANGKQELDFLAIAFLKHVKLGDFVTPACRQRAIHLQPGEHSISLAPRPRLVIQQREFKRQMSAMRLQISNLRRAHTPPESSDPRPAWSARLPRRCVPRRKRRDSWSVSSACFPTTSASSPAASLRSASICHIRSCAVTKPCRKIASSHDRRCDVRNAQRIARYGGLRRNWSGDLARRLRQRTPGKPVNGGHKRQSAKPLCSD